MTSTDPTVGAVARHLREQAGETRGAVAALLGIDQEEVIRLEGGRRSVTARELILLSRHYRLSASAFLGPIQEAAPTPADQGLDQQAAAADLFNRRIEAYFGALVWAP